jgi:hypothetical protein
MTPNKLITVINDKQALIRFDTINGLHQLKIEIDKLPQIKNFTKNPFLGNCGGELKISKGILKFYHTESPKIYSIETLRELWIELEDLGFER